jgi:hypothetical protein
VVAAELTPNSSKSASADSTVGAMLPLRKLTTIEAR